MQSITAANYEIVFNTTGYQKLNAILQAGTYTKLFIIVDSNTQEHCLPVVLNLLETTLTIEVIEIEPGEIHKTIETCSGVWDALAALDADRKGIIINLGGGVVTDLGGFVASTFKRGMDFINIPTSLLSMVDASVGGKTGVDLGALKNLIGVINNPKLVVIDTSFLATLPKNEMRSGLAEMYKHGLIASQEYWQQLSDLSTMTTDNLNQLIYDSIIIKNTVVLEDPTEQNIRKTLNYGHTLGHAIESYCLSHTEKETLLHGEAIVIGMILESYLSTIKTGLSQEQLTHINTVFSNMYDQVHFSREDINQIIELLKYDKKNTHGKVRFVLLEKIGKGVIDQEVSNDLIYEAFDYYQNQYVDYK